jgi:hypothetical protein
MRMRWRLVFPLVGLSLFGAVSYQSFRENLDLSGRYLWWSSIRLDSDPLNKYKGGMLSKDGGLEWVWVTPGQLPKLLTLTALPAFVAGAFLVGALGRLGVSQVSTFMISMPLLIFTWYYFIGRLVEMICSRHRL